MNLQTRTTTEDDWGMLKSIRLASLLESPNAYALTYEIATRYSDLDWRDRAAGRTPPKYFLACSEHEPCGIAGGVINDGNYELIAMWVSPQFRSKGIGKNLVNAVFKHAASLGKGAVQLMVSPTNSPAVSLYKSMGFTFSDHTEKLESNPSIEMQRMIAGNFSSQNGA